jgi:putative membrane protein
MKSSFLTLCSAIFAIAIIANGNLLAQQDAPQAEKTLIDTLSQHELYEIEAGKLAIRMADGEDMKDLAWKEVKDHELVHHELKAIADAKNISLAPKLTAELQQKLERLKGFSGRDFDDAYLSDLIAVHDKEEKLLAQESANGTGDSKAFAARTDLAIKQHLVALHGLDPKS